MEMVPFGSTGLTVSRLGVGLSELGGYGLDKADVETASRVLNTALDSGINFVDTSACYGNAEELIGRTISHRRAEFVLATKCGHARNGLPGRDWSAETIAASIDRSLARMRTDRLDLVQIHSCDLATLEQGEATEALLRAKEAGKTRFAGFSGDNDAAIYAVESGLFDALQTSYNVVDQHARTRGVLALAEEKGMGIIIKRPIANGVWGARGAPSGYASEYATRAAAMAAMGPIPGAPGDRILVALGFVLAHAEVDTAIVGTQDPRHMASNIRLVERGVEIPPEVVQEFYRRFDKLGESWLQRM